MEDLKAEIKKAYDYAVKVIEENLKLKEALEVYAEPNNWKISHKWEPFKDLFQCDRNGFDLAEKALRED